MSKYDPLLKAKKSARRPHRVRRAGSCVAVDTEGLTVAWNAVTDADAHPVRWKSFVTPRLTARSGVPLTTNNNGLHRLGGRPETGTCLSRKRAGMVECDGGLHRSDAATLALAGCVSTWLNRHPVCAPAGHCRDCGEPD